VEILEKAFEKDGISVLQWGHVFSDVEMIKGNKEKGEVDMLQWGHVFSDVEIAIGDHGDEAAL